MRVLIDFNGTMEGNLCGATLAETLQAALDIGEAGHDCRVMSGDPTGAEAKLNGMLVLDKIDALDGKLLDAMVIDDDSQILAAALRRGAIAVPAHRLMDVCEALTSWRKIALDSDGE